jgi:hypothetical protein
MRLLRNFEAGRLLDLMLVSAVTAVLGIRFYLAATGYPRMGGESLHIAHMLWGGLLMLAALVILISFVSRGPQQWGAVLGGLGFGTFIDEIGKFVTHDNDYFYQPAVSLIYVTLVLLYLGGRTLHREQLGRHRDFLANAILELLEIARGDLDRKEQERALRYLRRVGHDAPLASELITILQNADLVPVATPSLASRGLQRAGVMYQRIVTSRWFGHGLVVFFVARILVDLARLSALFHVLPKRGERLLRVPLINMLPADASAYGSVQWLQLGSSLVSAAFVAAGIFFVFSDRLKGLRMFQRSVLASVFLTQVFVFYQAEWLGLIGLAGNLLVFLALRFMIEQERAST